MLRSAPVAVLIGFLSACSAAEPAPDQNPLRDVTVDWENRTADVYTLTFAQNGSLVATGHMEPCSASGMGIQLAGPFSVGVAPGGGPGVITEPGPEVADSTTWREADGFVVIVIQPDGSLTVEERAQQRVAVDLCPQEAPP